MYKNMYMYMHTSTYIHKCMYTLICTLRSHVYMFVMGNVHM